MGFGPPITAREVTERERAVWTAPHAYVVVSAERPENIIHVFGLPQGGATREEAVFWAERFASKNGVEFARPDGWADVVGALPEAAS